MKVRQVLLRIDTQIYLNRHKGYNINSTSVENGNELIYMSFIFNAK